MRNKLPQSSCEETHIIIFSKDIVQSDAFEVLVLSVSHQILLPHVFFIKSISFGVTLMSFLMLITVLDLHTRGMLL